MATPSTGRTRCWSCPQARARAGRADRHHHGLDGAGWAFALRAGLVAVAQDQGGALRPVSGWRLEADGAVDHDDSRAALSRVLDGGGAIPAGRPLP
ncbi:hypothetical protein KCV87_00285 [Actinosynnema pretiosum subsp. pretiosum]|uniref:Uncharacterized protein n=1 Tax=Actinosynnema pretiosum subsp. pretiosum TaxID=103721 RepID=A0AA45L7A8_9PSEU|nr:hypothetical protein KCV87_00285 [Actinosynnema pretiosum subsp. pretiosum]